MVRAVDKADANADAFKRSIISGAIYHFKLELSVTLVWSRTEDMMSSTGWMSMRGLNTSLVWWCTGVCMTGHLGTSLITSSQPLMLLLAVFVYDPLIWIVSLFLAAGLARTAVGLFITLARQSETRCQMNLEIQTALTVLNDSWKQLFSAVTIVHDQHSWGFITRCASINLRFTYIRLLTNLHCR